MRAARKVAARMHVSPPPRAGHSQSFGRAVAVSGNTALLSACCIFDWPTYVFSFDPDSGAWIETQLLMPSDIQSGEDTGRAVAIDGDVALIAAGHVHEDETGVFYGAVFVFRYNGSLWLEEDELLASDSAFQDGFGASVSLSGDLAVIGALLDDDNGGNSGSAYVFRYDSKTETWIEEQKLLASDGAAGNFFGGSVAVWGNIAVIGARHHVNDGLTLGSAYVFRFNGSTWVEEQELLPSKDAGSAAFGSSVSICGDAILVGAHSEGSGSAYVFRFDPVGEPGSQWIEEQKLVAADPTGADQFGKSVALDGDTAVIGAWVSDAGGPSSGAAYVFRFDPDGSGTWFQQQQLLPEPNPWTNFFGFSVALDGETAVVGAHGEDQQRGAAYVFDVAINCNCPHDLDGDGSVGASDLLSLLVSWGPCEGCPADFDGNGIVGASDLLALLVNWGPCP